MIVVLQNQSRFVHDAYGSESPIVRESKLSNIEIPRTPTRAFHSIKETEILREDNLFMSIQSVTEIEDRVFRTEETRRSDKVYHAYSRF